MYNILLTERIITKFYFQNSFVVFSTIKGTICVYVINLEASYPQIVTAHYEDTLVTAIHWKRNEEQLFYGDNKGNVLLVNLTSFLVSFLLF